MKILTGLTYGKYIVGKFAGRNKHGDSLWECRCECGNVRIKCACNLVTGNTKSCGCLKLGKDKSIIAPPAPRGARYIQLTRGKWALVDAGDFAMASKFEWSFANGYARRNQTKDCSSTFLHRMIMGEPKSQVDHRNLNTLDNRRDNLREATDRQNRFNKPARRDNACGFKGVSLHRQSGKWRAEISAYGKRRRKSGFDSPKDAHFQYQKWAKTMHGEFARMS